MDVVCQSPTSRCSEEDGVRGGQSSDTISWNTSGGNGLELLEQLLQIEGPSGDECAAADVVERELERVPGIRRHRLGDMVLAVRGQPRMAVMAHLDTVGFTLGYGGELIPIGSPQARAGTRLRSRQGDRVERGRIRMQERTPHLDGADDTPPGSRWVFDAPLTREGDVLRAAYFDNRAGVWNALRVAEQCEHVAVAFTVCEEQSGRGALIAARWLWEELRIPRVLISDITWHTEHVHRGRGPAISVRDQYVPPQRFLDEIVSLASRSGIPHQLEIESSGSSDGGAVERSGVPMDWCFVGAAEEASHTPDEVVNASDLEAMTALYVYLIGHMSS
jgi:putative aminopeptidase FrvX